MILPQGGDSSCAVTSVVIQNKRLLEGQEGELRGHSHWDAALEGSRNAAPLCQGTELGCLFLLVFARGPCPRTLLL